MDSMLTLCLFLRIPLLFSAAVALFYYISLCGRVMHLMGGSTLFCLFILLLVDIFIVFTLGCWEQCCCEYWYTTLYLNNCFKFFVCMPRSGASKTYDNYISIFFEKMLKFYTHWLHCFTSPQIKLECQFMYIFANIFYLSLLLIFPILCALLRRKS